MGSAREPLLGEKRAEEQPCKCGVRVAGEEVEAWNDGLWSQLRALHGVPDHFLDDCSSGTRSVDFSKPRVETAMGKGGHGQFDSVCGRFVVKSLSGDDHLTLLHLAGALVDRFLRHNTMLCPIYLHFRDPQTGNCYMVMRNLTQVGPWTARYDLKGCADDKTLEIGGHIVKPVRKRFYMPHMWCHCNWSPARWQYYEGKQRARALRLKLAGPQRDEAAELISSDAAWLSEQGMMDYSLLLAVRRLPAQAARECGAQRTAVADSSAGSKAIPVHRYAMLDSITGELVVVTMGVIDFLQPWTPAKTAAMYIKCLEFDKATVPPPQYGERFGRHFCERLLADENLVMQTNEVARASEELCLKHNGQLPYS
eukprot:TRINITY_DN29894_c0_g2_i1.p1 TRINITY_DN29894_c0_g2~~TRINITY_DN29894_c0_g2_i1.p1  ORF type:complete len:378 (-),score=72.19 TRINITY_DN29894_c0_g2_i1:78-1178(-)